jgi:hypothetical protein
MKKISVMLCAFVACLFTACDTCGYDQGKPKTIYTWTYTNNGTTSSGEFETDEYGQAGFDVPSGTDCSKVDVKEKDGGNALPVSSPEN